MCNQDSKQANQQEKRGAGGRGEAFRSAAPCPSRGSRRVERHNLAQGASISIEDAWELAYVLSSEDTLLNAQNRFCELREERINNYRLFTGFTDFISHLDNFGQVSELRNRLMQFVPTSINERIFDFSLDQSLGGKGYTLQR